MDADGTAYSRTEELTQAELGREAILGALYHVIDRLLVGTTKVEGIGVGTAGRVNTSTGQVIYATDNLPGWHGLQLQQLLESRYKLPVSVDNDANTALLGEHWLGLEKRVDDLCMLTLGTGVGGANMIQGQLQRGHYYQGGEWGHLLLAAGGRPCNCGLHGCIEQYLSGTALVRDARERTGEPYTHGQEVFEAASGGDAKAREVVTQYVDWLALAIHQVAVSVNPELVLIGGGVIHSKHLWWQQLLERLEHYRIPVGVGAAQLGNQAGSIGAARLIFNELTRRGEQQHAN